MGSGEWGDWRMEWVFIGCQGSWWEKIKSCTWWCSPALLFGSNDSQYCVYGYVKICGQFGNRDFLSRQFVV